ncbi:MAG: type II secretion system F family protein, partial [Victivallales bacterium]|nr:type II secretion system F family protein [Victivallales bacterium]
MTTLQHRSQFYYQLATLLEAGVSMAGVFRRSYPKSFSKTANHLHHLVSRGVPLANAMGTIPQFSAFETAVVSIGERTGRLPDCCRALTQWYDRLHRIRQSLIVALLYPLMVYLLAGPLLTVVDVATGATPLGSALMRLAIWLALPWALLLGGKVILPMLRGRIWVG